MWRKDGSINGIRKSEEKRNGIYEDSKIENKTKETRVRDSYP
jgi:hypothetical protein